MIEIKTKSEIALMQEAADILKGCFRLAESIIEAGENTKTLDKAIENYIFERKATPSFKNYRGFPYSICASRNDCVIHGFPNESPLERKDIVSVDIGVFYKGFHSDAARTYNLGEASEEAKKLIRVTRESFFEGLKYARAGNRLESISSAIEGYVSQNGFSVVRSYVGHGIGRSLHEQPDVPNFGRPNRGVRLTEGMTLAIEPMVNAGGYEVETLKNGWEVMTVDKSLSAHYENTVVITAGEPLVLTWDGGVNN